MKEITDLIYYLGEMDSMARKCDIKQKKQFREVIKVILILLAAFKKSSNLGKTFINFKSPFTRNDLMEI